VTPHWNASRTATLSRIDAGKKIDMPAQQEIRSFKHAPKAKSRKSDDAKLF
jgi:hypothetical protein